MTDASQRKSNECPKCHGTGQTIHYPRRTMTTASGPSFEVCDFCGGEGIVPIIVFDKEPEDESLKE